MVSNGTYTNEKNKVYRCLVYVYTCSLIVLPSGSLYGINIKMILCVFVFAFAVNALSKSSCLTRKTPIFFTALMAFIALEDWIGTINGYEINSVASQSKDLLITVVNCWLVSVLTLCEKKEKIKYIIMVTKVVVFMAAFKCILLVYSLYTGRSAIDIVKTIYKIFHANFMTLEFNTVGSALGRIQFVSDSVIPVCIFFVTALRKEAKIKIIYAVLINSVLLASIFFSYSRYLWTFSVIAILLPLFASPKKMLLWAPVGTFIIAFFLNFTSLKDLVLYRFFSVISQYSDLDREAQKYELFKLFISSPFVGNGLGSHSRILIRSVEFPYSYELQILALLGQIGIVGCTFLLCALLMYYRRLFIPLNKITGYNLALLGLLCVWLCGGLFNPFLLSSTASVSYTAIYCLISLNTNQT